MTVFLRSEVIGVYASVRRHAVFVVGFAHIHQEVAVFAEVITVDPFERHFFARVEVTKMQNGLLAAALAWAAGRAVRCRGILFGKGRFLNQVSDVAAAVFRYLERLNGGYLI